MAGAMFGLPDGDGNSWLGQLFVMVCYGVILYKAAVLIGDGSEKLLLVYGPGIVGGLVIPILGAVPDGAIVLVSGLGSAAAAQCQVSVGVGTLAGSTIMLLTIPWALSLFLGCRDFDPDKKCAASKPNGRPKYENGFQLTSSCVTTYQNTVYAAKIMIFTSASYLIVLIPAIIAKNASAEEQIRQEHYSALVGFIWCALAFIGYSIFQLVDSRAQTTQELAQTKLKFMKWKETIGRKIASTDVAIKMAFNKFDKDGNGTIDREELQNGFKQLGLDLDRAQVVKLMADYQEDDDEDTLTEIEFSHAIKKWSRGILKNQKSATTAHLIRRSTIQAPYLEPINSKQAVITLSDLNNGNGDDSDQSPLMPKKAKKGYQAVDNNDNDEEDNEEKDIVEAMGEKEQLLDNMWNELNMEQEMDEEEDADEEEQFLHLSDNELIMRALFQLFLGTLICCIFSDPMVSVIGVFSDTIHVPSFYISFIVTPIASNAAEIYSSLIFAKKKTQEGISMGFSALYGAACMNNTFVLCIFCALVFFRRLQWTFIAETLVIILTVIVVGINGMRQTVKVWQGFIVISLFPLSILLVAVLDPILDDVTSC